MGIEMPRTRREHRHLFEFVPGGTNTFVWLDHWRSTDGNDVRVVPPSETFPGTWFVVVEEGRRSEDNLVIRGEHAEERAFGIAVGYIEQQGRSRSARPPTS